MAERGGFEPPNGEIPLTVFETAAFDRSAISPEKHRNKVMYNIQRNLENASGKCVFSRDALASPPWGETDRFAGATHKAPASPPWGETDRFAEATHDAPASQQQRNNLFLGASELTIATRSRSRAVQHYPVLSWRFAGNNADFEGSSGAFSRSFTPFWGVFGLMRSKQNNLKPILSRF